MTGTHTTLSGRPFNPLQRSSMRPHSRCLTVAPTTFSVFVLALLAWTALLPAAEPLPAMRLEVDAREISRKLLHTRQEIPVTPGVLALWYPKWVPGTHAPSGPVQNIAGL